MYVCILQEIVRSKDGAFVATCCKYFLSFINYLVY